MDLIDSAERAARRHTTPCGDGDLVWREWGEGPTLVLHHGGFGSWLHWVRNIAPLSAAHRVLAVDLPGLGESAFPPDPADPQAIGALVADGLDALLPAGEACDLVGFSFGGLVAGHAAARLGARVRSLTLVGASGLGLRRERQDLIPRTPDMDARALREAQAFNLRTLMLHDPANVDELALAIQAYNDERARLKSRRMSLGDSLRQALPGLRGRLNGIWGEHDVTAAPRMEERKALLASIHPGLDFRVIPDAGHWVQYEAADAFNAALLEMLAR